MMAFFEYDRRMDRLFGMKKIMMEIITAILLL